MRKYHRWLSVLFGVFILFIAITGLLSQVGTLVNNGGFEDEAREKMERQASAVGNAVVPPAQAHEATSAAAPAAAPAAPATFVCPEDMTCRPKREPKPGEWNVGFLHHIHSGEEFGPVGVIVSMLSGLALIFFAISGLYMYIKMFRTRAAKNDSGRTTSGGRFFW